MSAGSVIRLKPSEGVETAVEVLDAGELSERYRRLSALVARMGSWLTQPGALLLPEEEWEARFERYRTQLDELRRLGDELCPISLRDRGELLAGDSLAAELRELLAA